nr:DUF4418 family protein [uncultured Stomatobaculum sp.]
MKRTMRIKRIFAILFLAFGILLFLTPGTLAPVCPIMPDGSYMKCHWMDVAEQGLGAVIAFGGVLALLFPEKLGAGIAAMNLGLGVLSFLFAKSLIGGCKMHDMACNLYTRPMVYFLSVLLISVSAVYLLLALRGETAHGRT